MKKAGRSEERFPNATPQEAREKVSTARLLISQLGPVVEAVQIRRNEYLAHLDPRTVFDLSSMYERSKLTVKDLDDVLVQSTNVLNLFSQMIDRTISVPTLPGSGDCGAVLKLVADSLSTGLG